MTKSIPIWNEEKTFELNKHYRLSLGGLEVFIVRLDHEWQIRHRYVELTEEEKEQKFAISTVKSVPDEGVEFSRFMQKGDCQSLKFKPRLANRNIVAKPHQTFWLPSNEEVTIFISTPIWLSIHIDDQPQPLIEIPTFKLSDTWFGPKPHIGELCYASRFSGRTDLDNLPRRTSRIITPMHITNNSAEHLKFEKIAIPTEFLAVYLGERELWTSSLSVVKEQDDRSTKVTVDSQLFEKINNPVLLSEPRTKDSNGLLGRTVETLFR